MVSHSPDLVVLGNLLVDDIVLQDGTTLMGEPGGAVLHVALAASLWGTRVGIASVAGDEYPTATLNALAERGVDLQGVRHLGRRGGRAWLLHEPDVRRVIHHLDCPSHEDISPSLVDMPETYMAARAFHLAPMPIARQRQLAHGLAAQTGARSSPTSAFVSLDPYELLRDENVSQWSNVLDHVDAFFPSEDEVRISGDAEPALRQVASKRLRFVALKRGVRGGQLLDLHTGNAPKWTARAAHTVDVTGAGDAFVGGFLSGFLASGDTQCGIERGIVAASFAIEDWGARGLLAATPAQANARWQKWFGDRALL
jgi:sugar/nucleoside kinase (ribokinase family)